MGYKLLGIVVWKVAKSLLRYRYQSVPASSKSLLAGGAVLAIAGVLLAARRLGGGD
jgi:hypothetical protein